MDNKTLKWLYEHFAQDHTLRPDPSDYYRRACIQEARESAEALLATFSEEQNALYLRYEETHNALIALEHEQYFYQVFLFTRELLR